MSRAGVVARRTLFVALILLLVACLVGLVIYWKTLPGMIAGTKNTSKKGKKGGKGGKGGKAASKKANGVPGKEEGNLHVAGNNNNEKDEAEEENPEEILLQDIKHLYKSIKLIDKQVAKLADKIALEDLGDVPAGGDGVGGAFGGNVGGRGLNQPAIPRQNFPANDDDTGDSIFVSIASFRDVECAPMLQSMFSMADRPHKVYVGIVEQHAEEDPPCLTPHAWNCVHHEFCPFDNIRVRKIKPAEAKGPTFGRHISALLYRGQRYFMQVDSHNRFIKGWDTALIGMYKSLNDPKAVLTHYPEAYQAGMDTNTSHGTTAFLCRANFFKEYLKFDGIVIDKSEKPRLQPYSAAGFLFADSSLIHDVPFDPNLPFLFDGEEVLYTIRMWTNGYNMYSPSYSCLWHFYTRKDAPKIWAEKGVNWQAAQTKSEERVQYLLRSTYASGEHKGQRLVPDGTTDRDIIIDEAKYGLGKVRTLEEYYDFAGIDIHTRVFKKDWCKPGA